jgi:hypothetical protein
MKKVWVMMLYEAEQLEPAYVRIVNTPERCLDFTRTVIDLVGRCSDTDRDISSFKMMQPELRQSSPFIIRLGQDKKMLITRAITEP